MAFGLGVLRLPPEAFWRATPREMAAAIAGVSPGHRETPGVPSRSRLAALMAAFPDTGAAMHERQSDHG